MKILVNKKLKPRPFSGNPIKNFEISKLEIPQSEYQRIQKRWNFERIAANFDKDSYTRPLVAIRDDGRFFVINGGHTLIAMGKLGYRIASCEYIRTGSGNEASRKEAMIYLNKNNQKTTNACDKFKAAVCMGDEESVRINNVLKSCGLHVYGMSGKGRQIKAIDACRWVYRSVGGGSAGAEHLAEVLSILANFKSWSLDKETLSAETIGGLGIFLGVYGNKVKRKRLFAAMRGISPRRLFEYQTSVVTSTSNGPTTRKKLAFLNFREIYNNQSPVGQLPVLSNKPKAKKIVVKNKK